MFIEGRVAGQGGPRNSSITLLGVNIPHVYIINLGMKRHRQDLPSWDSLSDLKA